MCRWHIEPTKYCENQECFKKINLTISVEDLAPYNIRSIEEVHRTELLLELNRYIKVSARSPNLAEGNWFCLYKYEWQYSLIEITYPNSFEINVSIHLRLAFTFSFLGPINIWNVRVLNSTVSGTLPHDTGHRRSKLHYFLPSASYLKKNRFSDV